MEIVQFRWGPKPLKTEKIFDHCSLCGKPLTIVVAAEGQMASPTRADIAHKSAVCAKCYDSGEWEIDHSYLRVEEVA